MSKVIDNYYKQANVMPLLLKQKMTKLQRNADIMSEFEYWIEHKQYMRNGVSVEGYTARSLAKLSAYTDGEAAFMLLIELRETPDWALRRIKNGFKIK